MCLYITKSTNVAKYVWFRYNKLTFKQINVCPNHAINLFMQSPTICGIRKRIKRGTLILDSFKNTTNASHLKNYTYQSLGRL